jgi:hypothetical protein
MPCRNQVLLSLDVVGLEFPVISEGAFSSSSNLVTCAVAPPHPCRGILESGVLDVSPAVTTRPEEPDSRILLAGKERDLIRFGGYMLFLPSQTIIYITAKR